MAGSHKHSLGRRVPRLVGSSKYDRLLRQQPKPAKDICKPSHRAKSACQALNDLESFPANHYRKCSSTIRCSSCSFGAAPAAAASFFKRLIWGWKSAGFDRNRYISNLMIKCKKNISKRTSQISHVQKDILGSAYFN